MEFLASVSIPASATDLLHRLTISELPRWCASIEKVLSDSGTSGDIFCVWGTFYISREELCNGVRFSFPRCPNAFQWTLTTGHKPDPQHTFIHVTINRTAQDQDFVDSIQQFVDEWKAGLEMHW